MADCVYIISGYKTYFSTVKRNQNDGLIIFVNEALTIYLYEYGFEESNILRLTVTIDNKNTCIYCVYRSPSSNTNDFLLRLRNIFVNEFTKNECSILIGDINIDIIGNVNNDFLDMMAESSFKSFINIFTRVNGIGSHSCLDHIFIKADESKLKKINAGVIQTQITDHFSVITSVPISNYVKNNNKSTLINSINYDLIDTLLQNEDWSFLYEKSNVNELIELFYRKILNFIEKTSKLININSKNKRLKEWMTKGLLISTRIKNELSKKVKKHPDNNKLQIYYNKYKN